MADPLVERAQQAPRGPQGTWPDLRDVPARAREEAARELGPATVESLKPAFDDDEEDTKVIHQSVITNRQRIEELCKEFLADD